MASPANGKNIVICCDGTGNEFSGDCNSNVVKLYQTLDMDDTQVGYYHPGVGTMGSPTARNRVEKAWSRVKGLAFGAGLLGNVADAYRYLMNTYEEGDRVFLFGFSRGAYTARVLGGVIYMCGLLSPGNEGLIPYIIRMFAQRSRKAGGRNENFGVAHEFKQTFSRECPLHFVGVWDTVSSVGWIYRPVVLPFSGYNPIIRTGRHAVSIHERRCFFRQNLWSARIGTQDIEQIWFAGVHSDVGGSYTEETSGLSKVTLEWMLGEAAIRGLKINLNKANIVLGKAEQKGDDAPHVQPNEDADMHESLHGWWWLLEWLPHRYYDAASDREGWRIPLGAYRRIPSGSLILKGAEKRAHKGQLPKNYTLVAMQPFPRAKRVGAE